MEPVFVSHSSNSVVFSITSNHNACFTRHLLFHRVRYTTAYNRQTIECHMKWITNIVIALTFKHLRTLTYLLTYLLTDVRIFKLFI